MTTPSNINITELDFDSIKTSIVGYLQDQTVFTGYDFTGSNLNVLMDILSYNTHYNAFYVNAVANEAFLDSATTRNSVVSHAKMIGYTPHSTRASVASIDFETRAASDTIVRMTLSAGAPFSTSVDGVSRVFYTIQDYISESHETESGVRTFAFSDVEVYEGVIQSETFIVDTSSTNQRFILSSDSIDTETLKVVVNTSPTDTTSTVFQPSGSIVDVGASDNVYWIQEEETFKYEIFFGDGVIGSALSDRNLITVVYVATNGGEIHGAKNFSFSGTISDSHDNTVTITNTPSSFGGASRESLESIRRLAPINYQSQNRAVTADDYEAILLKEHPSIDSVYVWGGEDNNPPIYGKVFISIKPKQGEVVSDVEKETIKTKILEKKGVITIIPEIVEPDYIYLALTCTVYYRPSLTNKSTTHLIGEIRNTVVEYGSTNLAKFDKIYRESKLLGRIDSVDSSITGSSISVGMKKIIPLNVGTRSNYDLLYNNKLHPSKTHKLPSIKSENFNYIDPTLGSVTAYMKDDGEGIVNIYTEATGKETVIVDSFFSGTVDYTKGVISLKRFLKNSTSETLTMYAKPENEDIETKLNQILLVDSALIDINIFSEKN